MSQSPPEPTSLTLRLLSRRFWSRFRWLRPTMLALAGLSFALPFVTVSCDAPGGFGRVRAGGLTTYSGFDLAFGTEPERAPADHVLATAEGAPDQVAVQPWLTASLIIVVVALAVSLLLTEVERRSQLNLGLSLLAVVTLNIGQLRAHSVVADLVATQLSRRPEAQVLPAGDYVRVGTGFVIAMILLGLLVLAELILMGARYRAEAIPPPSRGGSGGGDLSGDSPPENGV